MATQTVNSDPLLKKQEAAEYLNVTPRWIERAIADEYIPIVKIGRLVRFKKSELDAWIERRTVEPKK